MGRSPGVSWRCGGSSGRVSDAALVGLCGPAVRTPRLLSHFPSRLMARGRGGRMSVCVCVCKCVCVPACVPLCGDVERSSTPLGRENSQWPRREPKALITLSALLFSERVRGKAGWFVVLFCFVF